MNRKLICTDLDGTLLNSDKKITKESERIIKALIAQGHHFCFVTGRSLNDTLPFYNQLGLNTICICNNGAAIHHPKDDHFDDIYFPMNNAVFFKLWKSPELNDMVEYFIIKTKHNTFLNKIPKEKPVKEKLSTLFHINFANIKNSHDAHKQVLIHDQKNRKSDILSVVLVLHPNVNLKHFYYVVKSITNNILISHWSIDNRGFHNTQIIVELNHNFANKLNALKFAQSYYDVLWADTIVFGDGENDVAMLSAADNSFAMNNSESHAITAGKHITVNDNNTDGVAKTLENLFMPN